MAQFQRNSNSYTGARSKTTFSTQQTNKQTKKGKKKKNESNEINAWGKGQTQKDAFVTSPEKKRESWTLWDNIEHEFPSCDNTTQLSNPCEQKQRRYEQPNVWVQRQKKFEENKALEPRDENEEEKMIRLALELSKRETQTDNMRKRLEEEYFLQEQMLKNNPDHFKEFHCEESSDAFPDENYPHNECTTESEEWDDGKYAMALKSNSSSNSSSNKKNYSIWGSTGNNNKQNQKTVAYKEIDNWEGYNRKTNVSPDKITSASGDGWDDAEYPTQESNSLNKIAVSSECSNYDNWGDCDNSNQSSSNCTYDIWKDYEQPKIQHKTISRTSSKYNTSDNWNDTKSSTYKDYNANEHDMPDNYSKSFKQKEYVKPIDKKTVQLSTVNETEGAKSKVRKVVDMFGGWGSGAVAENALKTETLTVAGNLGNNTGKSLNELKSSEPDHLDKLVSSMQETSLRNKDDDTSLSKNDSILDKEAFHFSKTESSVKANIQSNTDFFNEENNHEFKKNEKTPNLGVSDIGIVCQNIKDEAIVSDQMKLLENAIINTEATPTSQSDLPNKNSLVNPVISSTHNTLISQTPSFNTDISVNSKDELNNLHGSKADTISNEHSKQLPTSNCVSSYENDKCLGLPNQVPTFQSDEHINSPKESTAFHSNGNVQPPVYNAPFQPLNLNINSETQNITPLSPPFLPPELINMLSFPTNQMGGESTNPNLMGGMNPLLIQYMQMFSNPFLAAQWEMYYRTMGMPIGPMFFQQVPMMHVLRNPGVGDPINTALFENNARSDVSEQTLQNSPIHFTNEMLSSQEQNNISNSISTTSKVPETPIKLDEETESLLRSFLSPKEDLCNDEEVFIKPPVVQPDSTRQPNYDLTSVEKIESCDNQFNDSKNYGSNFSENVTILNNIQATTTESSECIGWGDLDFEDSKANQDKWDENVDGWGSKNSTTKSMGNPSCYNSAKSANRQPSRQPNFRHFRK